MIFHLQRKNPQTESRPKRKRYSIDLTPSWIYYNPNLQITKLSTKLRKIVSKIAQFRSVEGELIGELETKRSKQYELYSEALEIASPEEIIEITIGESFFEILYPRLNKE